MTVRVLVAALAFLVFAAVGALWATGSAYDPNHDKAIHTVRTAGIPAGVTPGPGATP